MRKLIVSFSCVLFVINTTALCQEWSADQKDAWMIVDKMVSAWASRDLDGYMSCLHDNFVGWFQTDPLPMDKKSLRNWEDYWLSSVKILRWQSTPVSIVVTDDVAIVNTLDMSLRENKEGEELEYSKWSTVCKKQDGKWLIIGMFGGTILED